MPSSSSRWNATKKPRMGSSDRNDMAINCPHEDWLVLSTKAPSATGTV